MKRGFFVLILWSAIIAALTFFTYSVIQLIGYGLSAGMLSESSLGGFKGIVGFIKINFKTIVQMLIIISITTTTLIYTGFIIFARKSKIFTITSYIMLIANATVFILMFIASSSPKVYSIMGININTAQALFGLVNVIFGISLILWKNKNSGLSKSIGILYMLEGIILLSSFLIPLRLAEFTISIRILEAVLFYNSQK